MWVSSVKSAKFLDKARRYGASFLNRNKAKRSLFKKEEMMFAVVKALGSGASWKKDY